MEIFGEVEELLHYLLDNYRHSFFRQEAIVATAVALKHSLESVANDFIEWYASQVVTLLVFQAGMISRSR